MLEASVTARRHLVIRLLVGKAEKRTWDAPRFGLASVRSTECQLYASRKIAVDC